MLKKEFEMKKQLIELNHKYKMEEIIFEKECRIKAEKIKHEFDMETQRIKNADISRRLMQK
jgi:hypothetical protein